MKINNKLIPQDHKKIIETYKIFNSKLGTTKDSTIIESIMNNLSPNGNNNSKKLKKDDFLKKEKSRAHNNVKELNKHMFVSTDCTTKNKTNISNFISSFENPKISLKKDLINSCESNRREELLHQHTKSEFNKRNVFFGSTLKNSKSTDKFSINQLNDKINILEAEKKQLEHEIFNFRKIIKNHKKEGMLKKIESLEKEKENYISTANHYLNLCSQLAEEVIILRNQVDKFSHPNVNNQMNFNINSK